MMDYYTSSPITDDKDDTRAYAITATQNLAFRKENRTIMVHYSNGAVLEALKKSLVRIQMIR